MKSVFRANAWKCLKMVWNAWRNCLTKLKNCLKNGFNMVPNCAIQTFMTHLGKYGTNSIPYCFVKERNILERVATDPYQTLWTITHCLYRTLLWLLVTKYCRSARSVVSSGYSGFLHQKTDFITIIQSGKHKFLPKIREVTGIFLDAKK